jgi:hypothetical protein
MDNEVDWEKIFAEYYDESDDDETEDEEESVADD